MHDEKASRQIAKEPSVREYPIFDWVPHLREFWRLETGHDAAFYESYAKVSSPIIGILASLPACYGMTRWIRRRVGDADALATVVAAGALVIVVDVVTMLALAPLSEFWTCAVAVPLKIVGGWLALRGVGSEASGEAAVAG